MQKSSAINNKFQKHKHERASHKKHVRDLTKQKPNMEDLHTENC